jgi:Ca2+/Na+ antiporter
MILSICFNPNEMDYRAWLTVSSLIMTSLVFILTRIDQVRRENREKIGKAIQTDNYVQVNWHKKREVIYNRFTILSFVLFVSVIFGIFLFIFHLEKAGAVIICLVLVCVILLIFSWFHQLKIETIMSEDRNESIIRNMIQRDIHPQTTNQPNQTENQ